jgi:hypothetical protein
MTTNATPEATAAAKNRQVEVSALLLQPRFDRKMLTRFAQLLGLKGELPASNGMTALGREWWSRETVQEWAATTAIHTRSALSPQREHTRRACDVLPGEATRASVRSKSWDAKERSFIAVAATETPCLMIDWMRGGYVREILLADGGTFPSRFPVLADHQRTTGTTIGSATDARREGTLWVILCRLASDALATDIGEKIAGGHLDAVGIGYQVKDYTDIYPGKSETIAGRRFDNDYEIVLRAVTQWEVHEVSVVPLGADTNARIRGAAIPGDQSMRLPAIHSHNSLSHRPSVSELVSAALMVSHIDDPSQSRYVRGCNGHHVRLEPSHHTEHAAEVAQRFSRHSWLELAFLAAELDGVRFQAAELTEKCDLLRRHVQSRSMSTANIEEFFDNSVASLVLSRWDAKGDSTAGWLHEADQASTRTVNDVQLTGAPQLTPVPRGGSANHSTFSTKAEQSKLTRYGAMFRVDEQDWIDGDSAGNIIEVTTRQLADSARALRPSLVCALLRRNPVLSDGNALFSVPHGNLFYSAALADGTLGAAMAATSRQQEAGVKLGLRGQYIYAPEVLERTAAELAKEVELIDSESMRAPIVRTDARLDDGFTDPLERDAEGFPIEHAGDLTTWFTSTADGDHGLRAVYLEGTGRKPRTRVTFLQQGYFGACIDIQHYLGISASDWRGLTMNVSAAVP